MQSRPTVSQCWGSADLGWRTARRRWEDSTLSQPNSASARQPLLLHQIFLKLVCAAAPSTGSRVRQPSTFNLHRHAGTGVGRGGNHRPDCAPIPRRGASQAALAVGAAQGRRLQLSICLHRVHIIDADYGVLSSCGALPGAGQINARQPANPTAPFLFFWPTSRDSSGSNIFDSFSVC